MPKNGNDATYFELRLIQRVCDERDLDFNYSSDLEKYKSLVFQSHGDDARKRLQIQESRLEIGIGKFLQEVSIIEKTMRATLNDLKWIGRINIGKRVADLDLHFDSGEILPLSVKSGGPGTERNLGGRSLAELIGYDSSAAIGLMQNETINQLERAFPHINYGNSWSSIRKVISRDKNERRMRDIAAKVGRKFQTIISNEIKEAWDKSTEGQKMLLLRYLALQNDERDIGLRVFVAQDDSAYFKEIVNVSSVNASELTLIPYEDSDRGTLLFCAAGNPIWRLNVNFTNGLGLSPVAIRVFAA